jgi:hypothetical protein
VAGRDTMIPRMLGQQAARPQFVGIATFFGLDAGLAAQPRPGRLSNLRGRPARGRSLIAPSAPATATRWMHRVTRWRSMPSSDAVVLTLRPSAKWSRIPARST